MKNKFFDSIYIFASLFMAGLLILVLYFSISYWTVNFPWNLPIYERMFYVAVGIAIVTSISQWIEGRINAIMKTIKGFKKEVRR